MRSCTYHDGDDDPVDGLDQRRHMGADRLIDTIDRSVQTEGLWISVETGQGKGGDH